MYFRKLKHSFRFSSYQDVPSGKRLLINASKSLRDKAPAGRHRLR